MELNPSKLLMIINGHSDHGIKTYHEFLQGNGDYLTKFYLPILQKGNVKGVILQIGGDFHEAGMDFGDPLTVLKCISYNQREIKKNQSYFHLITRQSDIDLLLNSEKIGILFSIEGLKCMDKDFLLLDLLYQSGLRNLALTHNSRNQFADGCFEKHDGGLSNLGIELIEHVNHLNMIIDLAHLSSRSFWEVMDLIKRPPIASHSNVKSICDHVRNLDEEQIMAIGEAKGVIGLNFYKQFVAKDIQNATMDKLIDHLERIVELTGIDHVGLGPDFYRYFWLDFECVGNIENESELPNFIHHLETRGFSKDQIDKICFKNFLRVIRKNL